VSKRYKVVGTQPIDDHQPGESFTASIPPDKEEFLVAIGGLKILKDEEPKKPEKRDSSRRWAAEKR